MTNKSLFLDILHVGGVCHLYYVIRDAEHLPPSIISEDNYFNWYNPMKKDHQVEFRGTLNECYDFITEKKQELVDRSHTQSRSG